MKSQTVSGTDEIFQKTRYNKKKLKNRLWKVLQHTKKAAQRRSLLADASVSYNWFAVGDKTH